MMAGWSFLYCIFSIALANSQDDHVVRSRDCGVLLTRLADSSRAIKSISVTYVSGDMSVRDKSLPAGSHLRREIAAMRPGFYMHWSFHPHDRLTWQNDPLQQRLFISDSRWYNVNPVKNIFATGQIASEAPLPGSAPNEFLWFATGIWPVDRPSPELNGHRVYLHELPALSDAYQIYPQEEVEGIDCHVVGRPNIDRIWIDKSRPMVVMAREFYDAKSGSLVQRFELLQHEEIAKGILFPRAIRNFLVTGKHPNGDPGIRESLIRVQTISVNQDVSHRFNWKPGPGALDVSRPAEPKQIIPGGTEVLDRYRGFAEERRSRSWNAFLRFFFHLAVFAGACWAGYRLRPFSCRVKKG